MSTSHQIAEWTRLRFLRVSHMPYQGAIHPTYACSWCDKWTEATFGKMSKDIIVLHQKETYPDKRLEEGNVLRPVCLRKLPQIDTNPGMIVCSEDYKPIGEQ